ncbi:MAG: galactose mutarotase [Proteobacteria bacterium]|nr:galactose mutarotase [Pseudomonadota bacterium]
MLADQHQEPLLFIGTGRLSAGITTFGAALWDLRLSGHDRSLVLGFDSVADYVASRTHAGSVVGRVCNRLGNGRALLDGQTLQLERNVPPYHLHGGATGFSQRRWHVVSHTPDDLILSLDSPDGHEGYPGNLSVQARYSITETTLRLELTARTDAPTLVNLCHHAYFNLSGQDTVEDHMMALAADRFLEVDANLVPTGAVRSIEVTSMDFRSPRPLRASTADDVLNHTMILNTLDRDPLAHAATVQADLTMELWTTQSAVHLYDGYRIPTGTPLRGGNRAGPRAGFCIEAQNWTDAPNHPRFPSIDLRPEDEYRQTSEYRFI